MNAVRFGESGIEFSDYPYPGASVFPSGIAAYAEIRDVDPWCAPPELRMRTGEVLFVSALQRDELTRVARERSLPVVRRVDVWGLVLEPFLDTKLDRGHRERTLAQLEACGISRREVARLRRRFWLRMTSFNLLHADWAHLGLADVLDACLGRGSSWMPLSRGRFERFYRSAMALAERGGPLEKPDQETGAGELELERLRQTTWPEPWVAVPEPARAGLERELRAELAPAHVLAGRPVAALARRRDRDDVLFLVGGPTRLAVVHLTGSGRREASADWPSTELFASLEELLARHGSD